MLHNKRGHRNEKTAQHNWRVAPACSDDTKALEAMRAQYNGKIMNPKRSILITEGTMNEKEALRRQWVWFSHDETDTEWDRQTWGEARSGLPQADKWAARGEGAVASCIGQVLCCTQRTLAGLNREAIYKGHWVAEGLTESWRTRF